IPTDIINNSENSPKDETDNVTTSARPQRIPLTVINESGIDIDIDSYQGSNILSSMTQDSENNIRILVVNSHSSEFVSQSISVSDAGIVITRLLQSAGIGTEYCDEEFDKEGRIGAYIMMKEKIKSELTQKPELVLVIDVHSSDSGTPITFTVGTGSDFGWQENLRAALGVIDNLEAIEASVRFLPTDLGQNSGVITLNIGICGADDKSAREAISSLVNAIIILYNDNPRSTPGTILNNSNF
ncbi:MAG: stage II sporulation protein P, partial [Clostridia bacterium]|nr:stage II sporulation protein P [Clostridia bacterium]